MTMMVERQQKLHVVPITLLQAQAFVGDVHRHHPSVHAHKFSTGVEDETGTLRGVAVMGRPGARLTPQYTILEVVRLATDAARTPAPLSTARRAASAWPTDSPTARRSFSTPRQA